MARAFRLSPMRRAAGRVIGALARVGVAPAGTALLTVRGRSSGQPRSTPVLPLAYAGRQHLVAPYGPVDWVRNLRAAGEASIRRGRSHRIRAAELPPAQAAPVLREYVRRVPLVRPYVGVGPDGDLAAFEAIAADHPVFSIERIG